MTFGKRDVTVTTGVTFPLRPVLLRSPGILSVTAGRNGNGNCHRLAVVWQIAWRPLPLLSDLHPCYHPIDPEVHFEGVLVHPSG